MLLSHRKFSKLVTLATLIVLSLLSIPAPRPVYAQSDRCFPQTNQCISGRFREYWEQNGGLAVFGYPISPARDELNRDSGKMHLTQWFERNRFELHPENDRTYDVLLGRLGDDTLFKMGRDWRKEYRTQRGNPDCETMVADGKDFLLCGAFRSYYKTHGLEFDGRRGVAPAESLALFGLPLTQATMETNASGDTVLTQWFERARMEWHPGNPEPYKVLLGLLGNEARGGSTPQQPVSGLKYLWPRFSPMTVWHEGSYADERSFVLHLAMPHATEPDATISGGAIAPPPEGQGTSVTVRGQRGTLHTLGARRALSWTEDGQFYMIYSNLRQSELVAMANDLEVLDLPTFRSRVQPPQEPVSGLKYLWPRFSPMTVWQRGSYADERSFVLHLAMPHATEPDATISGGAIAPPPEGQGTSVTVRGQRGTLHTLGARRALSWTEDGQFYMIYSNLRQSELVAMANDLEVLDLATFRSRLRP